MESIQLSHDSCLETRNQIWVRFVSAPLDDESDLEQPRSFANQYLQKSFYSVEFFNFSNTISMFHRSIDRCHLLSDTCTREEHVQFMIGENNSFNPSSYLFLGVVHSS